MATGTSTPAARPDPAGSYPRRVTAAILLGLVGLLALGWYTATQSRPPGLSPALAFVAVVVNNGILLVALAGAGAYAAPRVDLRSHLLARVAGDPAPDRRFRAELPLAAGVGVASAVAVFALDAAFAPLVAESFARLPDASATVGSVLAFVPVRFLFGGVTEELLLRFGLMAGVAYLGTRFSGAEAPSRAVMWGAILVSALLFGAGHLPATASTFGGLTPALVARALLLNGVAGVAFGWLYWQRSLESAMAAHVAFHVVAVAASLAVVA